MEIDTADTDKSTVTATPQKVDLNALLAADFAQQCTQLEKSTLLLEKRFTIRVLRLIPSMRLRTSPSTLLAAVNTHLLKGF